MHTQIALLANAYIEMFCWDVWQPETKRHWIIRRTVDYSRICLQ
jgi:hypothetical protein